ncbi:MAG: HDIG domain-containing metalloprotein [Myxococcota bacterium]
MSSSDSRSKRFAFGPYRLSARTLVVGSALASSLVLAALLTPGLFGLNSGGLASSVPLVGEIADRSYKAPANVTLLDKETTEELRRSALEQAPVVYDYDDRRAATLRETIEAAFVAARRTLERDPEEAGPVPHEVFAQALRDRGQELPEKALTLMAERAFQLEDQQVLLSLVDESSTGMIIEGKAELERHSEERLVVVRELGSGEEHSLGAEDQVRSLSEARKQISAVKGPLIDAWVGWRRKLLIGLAEALVLPNVNFNLRATEERREAVESGVKEVTISLRKGEIIVRDGDPVTARHVWILQGIWDREQTQNRLRTFVGVAGILLALLVVLWRFGSSGFARFPRAPRDAAFLLTTLVCSALGLRLGQFLCDLVAERLEDVPFLPATPEPYYFVIPIAAATMLVRLLHTAETSVLFAAIASLLAALELGGRVEYAVFVLAGSLVAARGVARVTQRGTVLRAGLRVGWVNLVVVGALQLLHSEVPLTHVVSAMALGFVGGLLSGVLVTGVAPLVEAVFSYTTDIKLLELANRDQPLLRDLELRAPGTYHHSMMVGHLAERAAEAIGANALLARVAAYYHDIGKMKRPHFFIENMTIQGQEKSHDKISPAMSARIIRAHVKDGLEYGGEHNLAAPIMSGIAQHHGTSLVRFFYEKARERVDPGKKNTVEEHDYRYPGPKPQTREAGILMLADSIEAASRTLADSAPARIQQLVQRITNNYFRDGQLDECRLTLRDLHRIAASFIDTLSAIRHERIDYPVPSEADEKKGQQASDEGVVERLGPRSTDRPDRPKEESEGDLRRLGLS